MIILTRANLLPAQTVNENIYPDYITYNENAKEHSLLYRGKAPFAYRFIYTGTYFAYSEEFQKGDLRYNDKIYHDVLLNINSHLDELYLFNTYSRKYVVLNKEYVDYFTLDGRKFVNIRKPTGVKALPVTNNLPVTNDLSPGYYEVIFKNNSLGLYKKIKKIYSDKIGHSYNPGQAEDGRYAVERIFEISHTYFFVRQGIVKTIRRFSDLLREFPEQKGEIRHFVRERGFDIRNGKDLTYSEVLKFVELNNNRTTK